MYKLAACNSWRGCATSYKSWMVNAVRIDKSRHRGGWKTSRQCFKAPSSVCSRLCSSSSDASSLHASIGNNCQSASMAGCENHSNRSGARIVSSRSSNGFSKLSGDKPEPHNVCASSEPVDINYGHSFQQIGSWSFLRLSDSAYGLCKPGASKYITFPEPFHGTNLESGVKFEELHVNCQQRNDALPLALTSTQDGSMHYVVFPRFVRAVKSLQFAAAGDSEFPLHPRCQGAFQYLACTDNLFYLIFKVPDGSRHRYMGAKTSSLRDATDWDEFEIHPTLQGVDAIVFGAPAADEHTSNSTLGTAANDRWRDGKRRLPEGVFNFRCGDPRASGYYRAVAWRNGRPEYCRTDDTDATIYWNSGGEWISYVEGYKGSSTLYSCPGNGHVFPCSDVAQWEIENGVEPEPCACALPAKIEVTLAHPGEGLQCRDHLKAAATSQGLSISSLDQKRLVLHDSGGRPFSSPQEPTWETLSYPVTCQYWHEWIATQASEESTGIEDAANTTAAANATSIGAIEQSKIGKDVDGNWSMGSYDTKNTICVLEGNTVTQYECDQYLRPLRQESDDRGFQILAKSNLSHRLCSFMARLKVRPAITESPCTKVAVSPHMEWALEALRQIQEKNSAVFDRALGASSASYGNDSQGMLDFLSDVGPRLQARKEDLEGDTIEAELESMIGLTQVKDQVRNLRKSLKADAKRREAGVQVPSALPQHMVFVGNPGVGKTSMARLIAKIFHEVGVTKGGRLVEAQREDLVAQYVGQTAPKARKVINASKGGTLFVDEAYRLTDSGGQDFGPEAVEELMKDLESGDPLVIVAGYQTRMDRFFDANPGLRRRFRHYFCFSNYTPREIADMFCKLVRQQGFFVEAQVTVDWIANLITDHTTEAWRAEHNGGVAALLLDGAKSRLDDRLCLDGATKWDLQTLRADDLTQAATDLQRN